MTHGAGLRVQGATSHATHHPVVCAALKRPARLRRALQLQQLRALAAARA